MRFSYQNGYSCYYEKVDDIKYSKLISMFFGGLFLAKGDSHQYVNDWGAIVSAQYMSWKIWRKYFSRGTPHFCLGIYICFCFRTATFLIIIIIVCL